MAFHRFFILGLISLVFMESASGDTTITLKPKDRSLAIWEAILKGKATLTQELNKLNKVLLREQRRLEEGRSATDKQNALVIRHALDHFGKTQILSMAAHLDGLLTTTKSNENRKIIAALNLAKKVASSLSRAQALLSEDPKAASFRAERTAGTVVIKQMAELINCQKSLVAWTEAGKISKQDLHRAQMGVIANARRLAQRQALADKNIRKRILEAIDCMGHADVAINQGNTIAAGNRQKAALKKLKGTRKELVRLKRQNRHQEVAYLLMSLEQRCRKMLKMQRAVHAGTLAIINEILNNKDKKLTQAKRQAMATLARTQKALIADVTFFIYMLEADGSASAFAEVFKQVRTDMEDVYFLLHQGKVGKKLQVVEKDLVETLEDAINALTKERQKTKTKLLPPPFDPNWKPSKDIADLMARLEQIENAYWKVAQKLSDCIPVF